MNEKTKKRYLYAFESCLNSGLDFEEYVKNCKDKHEISKLKNSLDLINLNENEKQKFKQICEDEYLKKPKYKKNPEEQFKLKKVLNTVNRLKSKRLKLGYRLQIVSGLRVSELAKLTLENIYLDNKGQMKINVINGKGGKNREVICLHDEYVIKELMNLKPKKSGKIFCNDNYIIRKAKKHNFHTHDLRKVFSHVIYYNNCSSDEESIKYLQEQLGHSEKTRTYLKYINRDINLIGTKWDNIEPF